MERIGIILVFGLIYLGGLAISAWLAVEGYPCFGLAVLLATACISIKTS